MKGLKNIYEYLTETIERARTSMLTKQRAVFDTPVVRSFKL